MAGMGTGATTGTGTPSAKSSVGSGDLRGIAVLIPAWRPDARLLALVADLQHRGLGQIVVVDDGNTGNSGDIIQALGAACHVTVCHHIGNQGKGQALKTAFRFVLGTTPDLLGVVTADADGQHLPADILRVAEHLAGSPDCAVLGVRSFGGRVPFRSRWGNSFTRGLFRLLTGSHVRDTQTGLRGLPMAILPGLLALPGERYEYEMVMLAHLCRAALPSEVEISTVYLEGNRGSHFHPLRDSLRVYSALLRATVLPGGAGARRVRRRQKAHLRPV